MNIESGLLVLDKPGGMTSHDVVDRVRRALGLRRVGHAGTLDPLATGVLLVAFGRATRLLRFLSGLDKSYVGTVRFGITTDTEDADGEVLDRRAMPALDSAAVARALPRFTGEIEQVPPMVSAKKVGGQPLYRLARRGQRVERAARPVVVHELALLDLCPGPYPEAVIRVSCSSGTYIRTLAADLGAALGAGAHLAELRRMSVGPFTIEEAVSLRDFEDYPASAVRPPIEALRGLPTVVVEGERARGVRHGAVFASSSLTGCTLSGPTAILEGDELIAVYGPHARGAKPIVVIG